MITYCKKCEINWARLWSEDVNDDTYEFCPKCKSSLDLTDGTDIVSYIKCHITGRISNVDTGEPHPSEVPTRPTVRTRKVKVWEETWDEFKERQDLAQYKLIDRYAELIPSLGNSEAYKKACEEAEPVERKFHYEEITMFQ